MRFCLDPLFGLRDCIFRGAVLICTIILVRVASGRGRRHGKVVISVAEENYICRKCGWEFKAIAGEEEPPECPECASDDVEKLELATFGRTTERK